MSPTTTEQCLKVFSTQLGCPIETLRRGQRLVEDLGCDSLDMVELVMEFEDEFDIYIADEQAEKIKTVGEAVAYIKKETA